MVTYSPLTADRNRSLALPYDGVVRVSFGGHYGTGVLLEDGRTVLTAAHLFDAPLEAPAVALVSFTTEAGTQRLSASRHQIHPGYVSDTFTNDLALLWLDSPAPVGAARYALYRASDEIGRTFTLIGYGMTGSGLTGATQESEGRLWARNRFDADDLMLCGREPSQPCDPSANGSQLYADFDDGSLQHDATVHHLGYAETGLGWDEGMIAAGDSGSPAFIDERVAGIASALIGGVPPDLDGRLNGSFGEIGVWQRVSHYQQWIDQGMRASHRDAPTRPQEVVFAVAEGDSGTRFVYFLVQFHGIRSDPEQIVHVDYATRDGTAQAWQDYLPVRGTLNLYPGEDHAAIAVEVIGDTVPEPNETFYLDVFNPVGGRLAGNAAVLTAVRTIIDDDLWFV